MKIKAFIVAADYEMTITEGEIEVEADGEHDFASIRRLIGDPSITLQPVRHVNGEPGAHWLTIYLDEEGMLKELAVNPLASHVFSSLFGRAIGIVGPAVFVATNEENVVAVRNVLTRSRNSVRSFRRAGWN